MSQTMLARRDSRRAALQLGAGAGAAAVAAPYARAPRARRARVVRSRGAELTAFAAVPDWPVPPIVTRAQWGAERGAAQAGPDLRLVGHEDRRAPHRHAERHHRLRRLVRGILANEDVGYIDIAYNWLIDPERAHLRRSLGAELPGRRARTPASATGRTCRARTRSTTTRHHRHRSDGRLQRHRPRRRDDRRARHAADVEVRAVGDRSARQGAVRELASNGVVENLSNICGHRDTSATDCPGALVEPMLPSLRAQVAVARRDRRDRLLDRDERSVRCSRSATCPTTEARPGSASARPIIGIGAHPSGRGYWLFGSDGGVFAFGSARFYGSTGGRRLEPADRRHGADADAATATGSSPRDGGMFCFGDATLLRLDRGDAAELAGARHHADARPGKGYWLYASDGGIFSFGDAKFYGSTGGTAPQPPDRRRWRPARRATATG